MVTGSLNACSPCLRTCSRATSPGRFLSTTFTTERPVTVRRNTGRSIEREEESSLSTGFRTDEGQEKLHRRKLSVVSLAVFAFDIRQSHSPHLQFTVSGQGKIFLAIIVAGEGKVIAFCTGVGPTFRQRTLSRVVFRPRGKASNSPCEGFNEIYQEG